MERPALKQLLADVEAKKVDIIVVYKVDRLTRSLMDFAKLVELMDKAGVSFVSVTQQFNTTTSMGRLTLNVLLSFAQFEREVTGERISAIRGAQTSTTVIISYLSLAKSDVALSSSVRIKCADVRRKMDAITTIWSR